jgi:hypothetical protein
MTTALRFAAHTLLLLIPTVTIAAIVADLPGPAPITRSQR